MLVTMREILDDARNRHYGVGMFNTPNVEMALGVLDAAEELKAPVIIGMAESLLPCCDLALNACMLIHLAKRAKVPVAIHLDHGFTDSVAREAIDLGFTSVMLDCSEMPYEENVAHLKAMVDYAHKRGASVEGELGHVVFDNAEDTGYQYTQPSQVCDFVERTGVDALAIAIGTAHGVYKETPVLDLLRLREIREVSEVGLVLHGGSGLSDDDFRNVVRDGIQKINIHTDVSMAASNAARDFVQSHGPDIFGVSLAMRKAIRSASLEKLNLFDCANKA